MAPVPELLLDTLVELVDEELKTFQWYLYSKVLEGFPHIPKGRVAGVDKLDTVNLLAQTYGYDGAVTVTVDILMRMKLKLWAETLKKKYDKGKMCLKVQKFVRRNSLASSQLSLIFVFVFYQFQAIKKAKVRRYTVMFTSSNPYIHVQIQEQRLNCKKLKWNEGLFIYSLNRN